VRGQRLCRARAAIRRSALPAASKALAADPALGLRIVTGGDDYEVLATVPATSADGFQAMATQPASP
jgi:thiamine monophosphate kinase